MAPETEHFPDLFCLITGHTGGIAAFFDLPCEKTFRFRLKIFGEQRFPAARRPTAEYGRIPSGGQQSR